MILFYYIIQCYKYYIVIRSYTTSLRTGAISNKLKQFFYLLNFIGFIKKTLKPLKQSNVHDNMIKDDGKCDHSVILVASIYSTRFCTPFS